MNDLNLNMDTIMAVKMGNGRLEVNHSTSNRCEQEMSASKLDVM